MSKVKKNDSHKRIIFQKIKDNLTLIKYSVYHRQVELINENKDLRIQLTHFNQNK